MGLCIELNSILRFNAIVVHSQNDKKRFTIYGEGIIDTVVRVIFNLIGKVFQSFQMKEVKLGKFSATRLYMTQGSLDDLFATRIENYCQQQGYHVNKEVLMKKIHNVTGQKTVPLFTGYEQLKQNVMWKAHRTLEHIVDALQEASSDLEGETFQLNVYIRPEDGHIAFKRPETPGWTTGTLIITQSNVVKVSPDAHGSYFATKLSELLTLALASAESGNTHLENCQSAIGTLKRLLLEDEFDTFIGEFVGDPLLCSQEAFVVPNTDGMHPPEASPSPIEVNNTRYIASESPHGWEQYFWEIVFEKNVPLVIKLAQNIESVPYWPNFEEEQKFDGNGIKVTCTAMERISEKITKRTFEVTRKGTTKEVSHLDFTGWGDLDVPDNITEFKSLLDLADETQSEGPIFVHCQKGIGRTGTFMAAHSTKNTSPGKIPETVISLRCQRPCPMVETAKQYAFIRDVHKLYEDAD